MGDEGLMKDGGDLQEVMGDSLGVGVISWRVGVDSWELTSKTKWQRAMSTASANESDARWHKCLDNDKMKVYIQWKYKQQAADWDSSGYHVEQERDELS